MWIFEGQSDITTAEFIIHCATRSRTNHKSVNLSQFLGLTIYSTDRKRQRQHQNESYEDVDQGLDNPALRGKNFSLILNDNYSPGCYGNNIY